MFFLCSYGNMRRVDEERVAETILSAPGWARVGITAPAPHLRIDAAHELARAILDCIEDSRDSPAFDQPGLAL